MIEAELKARVHAAAVMRDRVQACVEVYQDTYFDRRDGSLVTADQELRVRSVHGPNSTRTVLTWKAAAVNEASGSKPEHETLVGDADAAHAILQGLATSRGSRSKNAAATTPSKPAVDRCSPYSYASPKSTAPSSKSRPS